ncbi:Brp/Blh family beta-carotene 15,15'-dioxygenase [Leeuwenhoekiella sp. W20_SRS_FM14]|uniref:Brp/Blh family beta-carotene 15,15'-dioxygenase n=1 Tax=Leeuwenhoekiella sp. W20_SRS_FM14 TaxID=3240270 RepID=UPI003F97D9A0
MIKITAISLSVLLIVIGNLAEELLATDLVLKIALFLIATFGIIHGCNDLHLHRLNPILKRFSFLSRLILYLSVVGVFILLYLLSAQICLVSFVVFSAYHFGEEQLEERIFTDFKWNRLLYFVFGNCILLLLFTFNYIETLRFLKEFELPAIQQQTFVILCVGSLIMQFMMLLSLATLQIISFKIFILMQLELLLIAALCATTNLLIGFTTYFIFWHSIPSLKSQYILIKTKFSKQRFKAIALQSGGIYLIALTTVFSIFFLIESTSLMLNILLCVAIAITIPHILSIAGMYRR